MKKPCQSQIVSLFVGVLLFFAGSPADCANSKTDSFKNYQLYGKMTDKPENASGDRETLIGTIQKNIENEEYTEAMLQLNKLLDSKRSDPRVYVMSANLLRKTYQYDEAEKMAKKALQCDYKNTDAYLAMGYIYLDKARMSANSQATASDSGDYLTKSFDYFFMASQYDQASPFPHIALADAYRENKLDDRARDEILKAQELCVKKPEAYYQIGQYYYKNAEYDKAGKYIQKAIKGGLTYNHKTYFMAGMISEQGGKIPEAQKYYLLALKLKPNMQEAQKRLDELIKTSYKERKATENAPKDLYEEVDEDLTALMKADYYLMMDEFTESRNIYIQLLEKKPDNPNAVAGIAELYFSKWKDGFSNNSNFSEDALYILKVKPTKRNVIAFHKFEMINETRIPENVRQELINLSISETFDFYDLLNEVRAEFLLENYEECHNKLFKFSAMKLSNYEKFKILKSLSYDRNYYEALILIEDLKKTYYHNEEIEPIETRIRTKIGVADDKLNEALNLWKQKRYAESIQLYKELMNYFSTYKPSYLHYGLAMDSLGNYNEAYDKLNTYYMLYKLYPDSEPEISENEIKGLIKDIYKKQKEQIKDKAKTK